MTLVVGAVARKLSTILIEVSVSVLSPISDILTRTAAESLNNTKLVKSVRAKKKKNGGGGRNLCTLAR